MNRNILYKAKQELSDRRFKAENIQRQKLQTYLRNDDFKYIYNLEKVAVIENTKAEVYNLPLPYDLDTIYKQKQEILQKYNINESYFETKYQCRFCNDTGYVDNNMCDCLKNVITKILFESCGRLSLADFKNSNFNIFDNENIMRTVYKKLNEWCLKPKSKYNIVLLSGNTGTGKTFLADCMANLLIKNNKIVFIASAFKLNQDLLSFHTTFDNTKFNHISHYLDCEYLYIDDLGTENIFKNVTVEGIYNLIETRRTQNKKTIITTNLNFNELVMTYGQRISSRLADKNSSLFIHINNEDLRLKKQKEQL